MSVLYGPVVCRRVPYMALQPTDRRPIKGCFKPREGLFASFSGVAHIRVCTFVLIFKKGIFHDAEYSLQSSFKTKKHRCGVFLCINQWAPLSIGQIGHSWHA